MAKNKTLLQDNTREAHTIIFIMGASSAALFYFYGIFDAMEVAEINNLAYRYRQNGLYLQLSPDFNSLTAQPRLSLRLKYALGN